MRMNELPIRLFLHKGHSHGGHGHHHHGPEVTSEKSGTREIKVVRNVLDANKQMADRLRAHFTAHGVYVMNVMSSPGSGKTTTLVNLLGRLMPDLSCAVIVGDICSTHDADKLSGSGAPVIQINTDEFGGDCHLAAHVIDTAASTMDLDSIDLLIVENIGNLVCPAEFDIGEDERVVMLSVTEGEDKPLKYPLMFRECNAALLNKIDLLPYLDCDRQAAVDNIHQVHPDIPVFEISAKTEEGFDPWIQWLKDKVTSKLST
jgi:hydrogenase nickel incorporation protein HypB